MLSLLSVSQPPVPPEAWPVALVPRVAPARAGAHVSSTCRHTCTRLSHTPPFPQKLAVACIVGVLLLLAFFA